MRKELESLPIVKFAMNHNVLYLQKVKVLWNYSLQTFIDYANKTVTAGSAQVIGFYKPLQPQRKVIRPTDSTSTSTFIVSRAIYRKEGTLREGKLSSRSQHIFSSRYNIFSIPTIATDTISSTVQNRKGVRSAAS